MLPRNARPLFLLLLMLLFVAAPVMAAPELAVTITHTGNASPGNVNFLTGSTTGKVTVVVQNNNVTDSTTGNVVLTVNLAGGLVATALDSSLPDGLFTGTCTGLGTSTITCTSAGTLTASDTETLVFSVTAPANPVAGDLINTASVTGGGSADASDNDDTPFGIYNAGVDMRITSVAHAGSAGNHFYVNSNGTVTVNVQNLGADATSGTLTLNILLDSGLVFVAQSAGSYFTNCAGSSNVTCSTVVSFNAGDSDTITFTVQSSSSLDYDNLISAILFGGGDDLRQDSQMYSVIAAGTATVTPGAATFTPLPTFPPVPGVPGAPGTGVAPTAIVTPTLIPPIPTRTPLPRPANAGQAIGPIPRPGVTVVVDRDGVSVRLLPAIGAEVIATVNAGFSTEILARSPDNEWVQISLNGELGWIGTAVLAIVSGDLNSAPVADPRTIPYGGFENPRAGLTSVTSQYTGKLQNSGLRVRGGPSRSYPVLANAPRYTIFSLLGRSADNMWLQVNFEGTLGWVAMQFVELQQGLGTLDALPIDGIVADAVPVSEPTADNLTDTLRLMLARLDIAQGSLNAIRSVWTNVALGERVQCGNYPARPTNFNIPNPVLAPFYGTLFPLNTDFNSAMESLRSAIDLLIDVCRSQSGAGTVGEATVQQALDAINAADALFASLRQRLTALLPAEGPIDNETQCLFSFNDRAQVVPRLRPGEAQIVRMTKRNFVLGFCFDGGMGQSFSLQVLRVNGNAEPRITVSAFDNPTNFIATGEMGTSSLDATSQTSVTVQPILIAATGRYLAIIADLDGAPNGDLDSEIAILLTDITSGGGGVSLGIDPNTGNVIIAPNAFVPSVIGVGVTPGIPGSLNLTPVTTNCPIPNASVTCEQLQAIGATCEQAIACMPYNPLLDSQSDADLQPCEQPDYNICPQV